jgi:hypothetical protein
LLWSYVGESSFAQPGGSDSRVRNVAEAQRMLEHLEEEKRYYLGAIIVADGSQVRGKTIVPWDEEVMSLAPRNYPQLTLSFPV